MVTPVVPPRLRRGDCIGVVAPSSPQRDDERLKAGIRYFESLGYRVRIGEHLWKRYGYLAGTDQERLDDLNAMIRDPEVRMIIGGRGGYGVTRILDGIDYRALRRDPKIVAGFSDLTALNCAILVKAGLVSYSGAMPGVDFWNVDDIDPYAEESFWKAVTSSKAIGKVAGTEEYPIRPLVKGRAEGWLLPGNLTLFASITGTPYLPKMRGAILLIEEIGEEAYRVDRLLAQLRNAGHFNQIVGLAFGAFTGTDPRRVSVDPLPIAEVLSHYATLAGVPAITDVPFGHIKGKATLPVGVTARIDGTRGTLRIEKVG